jgi:hypothetical protein
VSAVDEVVLALLSREDLEQLPDGSPERFLYVGSSFAQERLGFGKDLSMEFRSGEDPGLPRDSLGRA